MHLKVAKNKWNKVKNQPRLGVTEQNLDTFCTKHTFIV